MPKGRTGDKTFNYSGTMICGECGSAVTAEEKRKLLSNGTTKTYIYYLCSKYTKRDCRQFPVNELDLIPKLIDLMDGVNLDKFLLRTEYEYELTKYHKMSEQLDNKYQVQARNNIDIRSQMKYVVENGSREDRIRLLKNIGSKIYLKDRDIYLAR
jgi:hypothetical protein